MLQLGNSGSIAHQSGQVTAKLTVVTSELICLRRV